MPRGDKSSYSDKQKRQAEHIEEGYKEEGVSTEEAERRAWATVNKQTGGATKKGGGRKKASKKASKKSGGKKKATKKGARTKKSGRKKKASR
jgi:plasmid stabilization system protein ParE